MTRIAIPTTLLITVLITPQANAQCTEPCTAIHTLDAEASGDFFGWVSNEVGDLDNDGVLDFLITAPGHDTGGSNAGRVYVYSGATGNELFNVTGTNAQGWLGHDAACAGDIDNDGIPDIIAGSPFGGTGFARIYAGGNDGGVIHTFQGESNGDQFGFRVYGGGDFDGDGRDDVIIGAPRHDTAAQDAGRAYIYSGDDFQLICSIDGPTAGDFFGSGVAFIGDINDDGRSDVAIGAQNAGAGGGLGFVYTFDGTTCSSPYTLNPGTPSNNFGRWFMNGGHDVNDDGFPDIYINDFSVNRGHIFSGVDGSIIWQLNGNGEGGGFGIGRIIPDINGDFHADMILASWASGIVATGAGKVFVYSGRTGEVFETFTHDVANAGFGFDANGMGDVNGDGRFDHLITAASHNGNTGRAFLIAGNVSPVSTGDADFSGTVDLADVSLFIDCAGDPDAPIGDDCTRLDTDFDNDVDFADFARMQQLIRPSN